MARDPTFREACKKALGGGIPGAIAMVLQVVLLMWLRTVINVQMSTGGTFFGTIDALYKEGGIPRFYQGMWVALLQAPLSRFGDTAANAGVLSATNNWKWPIWLKTAMASLAAALWRIVIMPVDTCKTLLQVHGSAASGVMMDRMAADGIMTLYAGASAATLATFMGHYPWFATNNFLEARVASFGDSKTAVNVRRALIGFCCSFVSDCISNSTRVVKTYCQTSKEPVGYLEAVVLIVSKDGIGGLLWRGLAAKLLCNGLGSILFSVVWKILMEKGYFDFSRTPTNPGSRAQEPDPKKGDAGRGV